MPNIINLYHYPVEIMYETQLKVASGDGFKVPGVKGYASQLSACDLRTQDMC